MVGQRYADLCDFKHNLVYTLSYIGLQRYRMFACGSEHPQSRLSPSVAPFTHSEQGKLLGLKQRFGSW